MEDNKFWLGFWAIAAVLGVVIATYIAITTNHTTDKIAEMVKAGADPVLAACAVTGMPAGLCAQCAATLKGKGHE
ncbi:hypothetical protein [Candidimonas nitroreducens]|uniref:Uncharacterized protein n=1 Tax=Candidimonas nitroreducens TaxID=683354 RepID=A0A225M540_9BURK|nr:hypothetical protein [Candidimonas nitroreducens]OWT55240.1 hypothetical protein CEY11_21255 [Candidimonas nitroreducens]